jgi:hypothetical protein
VFGLGCVIGQTSGQHTRSSHMRHTVQLLTIQQRGKCAMSSRLNTVCACSNVALAWYCLACNVGALTAGTRLFFCFRRWNRHHSISDSVEHVGMHRSTTACAAPPARKGCKALLLNAKICWACSQPETLASHWIQSFTTVQLLFGARDDTFMPYHCTYSSQGQLPRSCQHAPTPPHLTSHSCRPPLPLV